MSNYKRLTLEDFKNHLRNGRYDSVAGARRAIGKTAWNKEDKEVAYKAASSHFSPSMEVTSKGRFIDSRVFQPQLLALKKNGMTRPSLAKMLSVSVSTVDTLLKGSPIMRSISQRVADALQKDTKYQQLLAAGHLVQLSGRPKQKTAKKSVIETAPAMAGMPSPLELDLQELAVLRRLRAYQLPPVGAHLNGKRAT